MSRRIDRATGYILVSTIWVVAFLGIAAASIGEWYARSLQVVGEKAESSRALVLEVSTRAALYYEIATSDVGLAGIFLTPEAIDEEGSVPGIRTRSGRADIIFDGTAYQGYGNLRFSIQDENGLWGLVPLTTTRTRDLLIREGIEFSRAEVLADRLADYVDRDDLVRINGAEAADYRFAGLPPPANRPLESVYELKNVLGWSELDVLWRNRNLTSLLSIAWGGKPNPMTAPREVLLKMPGATPDLVDGLLARRHGEEADNDAVDAWISLMQRQDVSAVKPRPSRNLRLRFWREGEGQVREYSVKFTAGGRRSTPWVVQNNTRKPLFRDQLSATVRNPNLPDFVL